MSKAAKAEVQRVLGEAVELLDDPVFGYVAGVLTGYAREDGSLFDFVGPTLLSMEAGSEETVRAWCDAMVIGMLGDEPEAGTGKEDADDTLLMAPVSMGSGLVEMERDWAAKRRQVDVGEDMESALADVKVKRPANRTQKRDRGARKLTAAQAQNMAVVRRGGEGHSVRRDLHLGPVDLSFGACILLEDADIMLAFGRRYGLVGRNGSGKTTLMRAIYAREVRGLPKNLQILHVEQEAVADDTTAIDSVLEADAERAELLREAARLEGLGEARTEADDIALGHNYERQAAIEVDKAPVAAAIILSGLGFTTEMQNAATKTFSGGWRMRIALARALFCKPELLLLDEPTNLLDINAKIWLEDYLQTWETTLLTVSHDRHFLNSVCTDVIHLHGQQLVTYKGNYEEFERQRAERLKHLASAREAQEAHRDHIQKFVDRFRFNAKRASLVQSRIKMLKKMKPIATILEDPTYGFIFPKPEIIQPPLVRGRDVSFGYHSEKILFRDQSFIVDQDSRVALVGNNGQGKTTLLKLLTGELEPTTGDVYINPRLRCARFTQHHVDQLPMDATPVEALAARYPGSKQQDYRAHLGRYGVIGDLALQTISTLSGGQKSRVVFAIIAWPKPHLLALDEPENHLDVDTVDILAQALNEFEGGVVMVSHNERLIRMACNDLWIVHEGSVTSWRGDFDAYRTHVMKEFADQQRK